MISIKKQSKAPNFYSDGKLYLVRCFNCDPERGTENYIPCVSSGSCAWCGWSQDDKSSADDNDKI